MVTWDPMDDGDQQLGDRPCTTCIVTKSQTRMKTLRNALQGRICPKPCGRAFVKSVCGIVRKGHPKKHNGSRGHRDVKDLRLRKVLNDHPVHRRTGRSTQNRRMHKGIC